MITVVANDVEFACLELGSGPLVLCMHGFPDTAHTWRHLMPQLASQGFRVAYRYLQARRGHLRYADYRRLGLPIGSGVTEAACKTVFTQRLKCSGMRWQKAGAQTILRLRVLLLSGVLQAVCERLWATPSGIEVRTPGHPTPAGQLLSA